MTRFGRGTLAAFAVYCFCATAASDARAAAPSAVLHSFQVILQFSDATYTGTSVSVSEVVRSVAGSEQARVNVAVNLGTAGPGLCTIAVSSTAEAARLKDDLLNDHTQSLTCGVAHATTTDPTAGIFVFLNTLTPNDGEVLILQSH
jgi:hypothetical protein